MSEIIFIAGPTAVGKSAVAVALAQELDAEIISADAMQIYRGMDIGTGKITRHEMQGVVHHMIDIVNPDESFSVGQYAEIAGRTVKEIEQRNRRVIVAGGTGLYMNALINGMNFAAAPSDEALREHYRKYALANGNKALHELLHQVDPVSAERIAINDVKRVIRALEIFELTGKPKSKVAAQSPQIEYRLFVLNKPRETLYDNINRRVQQMFANGLIDEVLSLMQYRACKSMQAIGYKEVVDGLQGEWNHEEIIEKVKQNSRRYAKRQLTYFRHIDAQTTWFEDNYLKNILKSLKT